MADSAAIRTMPDDLAAARAKNTAATPRRTPRRVPPQPLFPLLAISRRSEKSHPVVNLPTGERREKVQVSAIAITLAFVTLILGGLIALILELT